MIADFQNWSLQRCKETVIEYQSTRDKELFHYLLARFDKYILHVIYEMRRSTPYLWGEDMQELYHTGILGFHKGISAFKHHLDPFFLVLVIKAYVKAELKQVYSYKRRECCGENLPVIFENDTIERELDIKMLFELLETSIDFSPKDKELINLRFKQDKPVAEIAQRFNRTEIAIYKNISRVVAKLKRVFDQELKTFL